MGVGIYPIFRPSVSVEFDCDGKQLLREYEALDAIASSLNLSSFSGFGDDRDIPAEFDGSPEELEEMLGERNEWSSLDEGLQTIDGILEEIRSNPSAADSLVDRHAIEEELASLAACLRHAQPLAQHFRLEIG